MSGSRPSSAKESSFAKVAQAYLAEIKPAFALSSYRTKESRIRKYLSPKFDGMPMSDIGVKQIRPLLEECKAHGAWAAIHVKGDLSAIRRPTSTAVLPRLDDDRAHLAGIKINHVNSLAL